MGWDEIGWGEDDDGWRPPFIIKSCYLITFLLNILSITQYLIEKRHCIDMNMKFLNLMNEYFDVEVLYHLSFLLMNHVSLSRSTVKGLMREAD